jgi:hypothetical protein
MRVELMTSFLPRTRSTTELCGPHEPGETGLIVCRFATLRASEFTRGRGDYCSFCSD